MANTYAIFQWSGALLLCGTFGLSGCAGKPPTPATAAMSQAELAVQRASQTTAPQHASLELYKAQQQLQEAQAAMHDKEYTEARRLAENALVNAQLAEAKAEAEQIRQAAVALQQSIQSLRQEAELATTRR
jgi:hypothetical protein